MDDIRSQPPSATKPQPFSEKPDKNVAKRARSNTGRIPSTLLADITFERKNKPQPRLPPNHKIQKRPIIHPPIAAPYAGPDVQKVVYVSRNTPIMAAVKRVRKLLDQVEKRNLQREGVLGNNKRTGNTGPGAQKTKRIINEEILVKGSGRAIEQAVKVGEWFKRHAEDGDGGWVVNVRPSSVKVVDDIVEDGAMQAESLGNQETYGSEYQQRASGQHEQDEGTSNTAETMIKQKVQGNKKRKRPMYDEGEVPEARTRFIDAIEIAISLK